MDFNTDTIYRFVKLTGFDLQPYLLRYEAFMRNHYPNIVDYYRGSVNDLRQESVKELRDISALSEEVDSALLNIGGFTRMDDWNLVYAIDEIRSSLMVIKKISKFLRSAKYEGFNENLLNIYHTVGDHETPEMVVGNETDDPENDWVDTYVKNHILETDYQAGEGGYIVLVGRRSVTNLVLRSVVDNLQGENVYGKDIDVAFAYVNNDVKVLLPKQTVRQSVGTLAGLRKRDIPEFPELGISTDVAIGGTVSAINVPFIVRQMSATFSVNDTLQGFKVTKVETRSGNLYIEFDVDTFRNRTITQGTTV